MNINACSMYRCIYKKQIKLQMQKFAPKYIPNKTSILKTCSGHSTQAPDATKLS